MKTLQFKDFKEATRLAKTCAFYFETEVNIKRANGGFSVAFEGPLQIRDNEAFARYAYLFGPPKEDLLSLLSYVEKAPYISTQNTWRDSETGLTWDVARLFYGNASTDIPRAYYVLMNSIQYGGLTKWRLPSLDELNTLTIDKLLAANPAKAHKWGSSYWSCEDSVYSGPEKSLLDLRSRSVGHQRYIEQDRSKSTYGDGYRESAQTILVCSA